MTWWIPKLTEWHWKAVVARLGELPREERRRTLRRAMRAAFLDRRVYIPGGVAIAALAAGAALLARQRAGAPPSGVIAAMVAHAVSVAAGLPFFWVHGRVTRCHLAAEFPTLCPTCGYDRRATPDRCPECGSPAAPAPPADAPSPEDRG